MGMPNIQYDGKHRQILYCTLEKILSRQSNILRFAKIVLTKVLFDFIKNLLFWQWHYLFFKNVVITSHILCFAKILS